MPHDENDKDRCLIKKSRSMSVYGRPPFLLYLLRNELKANATMLPFLMPPRSSFALFSLCKYPANPSAARLNPYRSYFHSERRKTLFLFCRLWLPNQFTILSYLIRPLIVSLSGLKPYNEHTIPQYRNNVLLFL